MARTRSERNTRRHQVQIADSVISDVIKASARLQRKSKDIKRNRIRYLKRMIGSSTIGFRHRQFMTQRQTTIIRPIWEDRTVGKISYEGVRKVRPSEQQLHNGQRDGQFRCGHFFGDMPWLMATYAQYLSQVLPGDHVRTPTDVEMRSNFGIFWERMRHAFGANAIEAPAPAWVIN